MTAHEQVLQAEQLLIEAGCAYAHRPKDNYTASAQLRDAVKAAAINYGLALQRFANEYRAQKNALPLPPE